MTGEGLYLLYYNTQRRALFICGGIFMASKTTPKPDRYDGRPVTKLITRDRRAVGVAVISMAGHRYSLRGRKLSWRQGRLATHVLQLPAWG